ncbi:MAG TPA: hypothetical protein VGD68_16870 [Streptosporangiaceae bacterium]
MYASAHGSPSPRPILERFLIRQLEYRHPRGWLAFRVIAGLWNLGLGLLLLSYGYWPGLIPLLASPAIFWAAHRMWTRARARA